MFQCSMRVAMIGTTQLQQTCLRSSGLVYKVKELLRQDYNISQQEGYRMFSLLTNSSLMSFKVDDDNLPRITCPQKMLRRLEQSERKRREKRHEYKMKRRKPTGPLLISCKRKDYNFYQGQHFNESDITSMVSCGWKNTRRIGDHFTLMTHSENPSLQSEESPPTFEELGLTDSLCSGLKHMGLESPTEIQKLVIPSLLHGDNVIAAAETGSGKTLSYLVPCVQWILKRKEREGSQSEAFPNSPAAIVVTPNRELTTQVMGVAKTLASFADFTPQYSFSGSSSLTSEPVDMLVSTPGNFNRLLKKNLIQGHRLQHIVIDESDTLLDDSFVTDLQSIFNRLKIVPAEEMSEANPYIVGTQIVLVSATMPRNISDALGTVVSVDDFVTVQTNALHRLPPHVPQKFFRINPSSKPEKLIQLLHKNCEKKESCMVFVKDSKTCHYLSKLLEEMGVACLHLSGELTRQQRQGVFQKFSEGYEDILIATDIASRGLDTTHVSHVINYDFPQDASDYIHRVGRVGRLGSKNTGQVTSLVSQKWEVDLVWKIEIAARRGSYLRDVDANIKQKLEALKTHKDQFELNVLP